MKTILIATDFSAASNNAIFLAIEYARAFKTKLILYHAFRIIYTTDVLIPPFELKQNCKEELQNQANKLNKKPEIDIEVIVEEGISIADSILDMAKVKEASIIFMGMKKQGRTIRKLFGSIVTRLSHQSEIPIIVVPEGANIIIPKTIALANDIDTSTNMDILYPLKEVVEKFQSKLFLARIIKPDRNETLEKIASTRIIFHLADLHPQLIFVRDTSVNHGLSELLKENKADMVAMIPHHHNILEKLLESSKTDYMLIHSQIPVMILPDKDGFIINGTEKAKDVFDGNYYAIE